VLGGHGLQGARRPRSQRARAVRALQGARAQRTPQRAPAATVSKASTVTAAKYWVRKAQPRAGIQDAPTCSWGAGHVTVWRSARWELWPPSPLETVIAEHPGNRDRQSTLGTV